MTVLETNGLKKYYGQAESLVKALDGVNLKVEQGEFVSIVGTSGSGTGQCGGGWKGHFQA